MSTFTGTILEIRLGEDGYHALKLATSPRVFPAPGRYLLAETEHPDSVLPVPLFRAGSAPEERLQIASPWPPAWMPGQRLRLRGPLGHGFTPPQDVSRLALAALGGSVARLLPLLTACPAADVAIFSDAPFPHLAAEVEAYPLAELPSAVPWADFLALDCPLEALSALRTALGLTPEANLPCPAQALI